MKNEIKDLVGRAKAELINTINFVVGTLRMQGLTKKVAIALALIAFINDRASVKNISETFNLDYNNLLKALEEVEKAWTNYLDKLRELIKGPVIIIIDDTFDHKEYARARNRASGQGNYIMWCQAHKRFESGVQLLTIAIYDLNTKKAYMIGAFPYAIREMYERGMVKEFQTKIQMASALMKLLREKFQVMRVVFDSWYWSSELVTDKVVSELKSNRRVLRVKSIQGTHDEVEGHLHVGDLPPGSYLVDLTLKDKVITVKLFVEEYKDYGRRNLYTTDLSLSKEEVEETWRIRWEIEKFHRDIKVLGLQDTSFFKRVRLQGYVLLFVMLVNAVRELLVSLNLRSVEELLRFVERHLGGIVGLMKIFKLR
ncbi:ISNCY family transposase [Sulfolobus sp. E11-6]|uniref:ISNCY family transposase n=1 Tax=Sulfolobus sp. E11-6 TaxID=2663020 RepID=UPI001294CCEC|nr:ISNCY family transposase [Sulfolobus sp. E11-6]QGA68590.1 ISNCY family transposase [Sulfolobus sp. E11-6]